MSDLTKSDMTRREFIGAAATALFAGVAIHLVGCNSSTSDYGSGSTPAQTGDMTGVVGNNHPAGSEHLAILTKVVIDAGAAYTLHIQGNSSHDHTVDLAATDVANIKAGGHFAATSSTNSNHSHAVTFN